MSTKEKNKTVIKIINYLNDEVIPNIDSGNPVFCVEDYKNIQRYIEEDYQLKAIPSDEQIRDFTLGNELCKRKINGEVTTLADLKHIIKQALEHFGGKNENN
jgi:hypothetical protein